VTRINHILVILRKRKIVLSSWKQKVANRRSKRLKKLKILPPCLKVTGSLVKKIKINAHSIRCKRRKVKVKRRKRRKNNQKEDVHLCQVKRRKTLLLTAASKDGTKNLYLLTRTKSTTEGSCPSRLIS